MTLTTPCRLITLHFSHLALTEALTFIIPVTASHNVADYLNR
ncbi:MAG: hypothetical protein HW402_257 [Dehalococcoidales bacterium]|nr:hypothetical protein [Dehalococcoidales bacterium]